ncbi:hypothetical protein PISMIDRAFT_676711 [Pisolithus microcarpus 441]|uniref:Uncharacterized protein n=1 Tax=Pisolithus microcarpus 441 TaxID=765257 RepID=A0A0C9ZII1_9AGAM|nr:hypothetical protein PISMIDRAFT_676711 [Pisolithus microcarpus 441]
MIPRMRSYATMSSYIFPIPLDEGSGRLEMNRKAPSVSFDSHSCNVLHEIIIAASGHHRSPKYMPYTSGVRPHPLVVRRYDKIMRLSLTDVQCDTAPHAQKKSER